jgi:DNA invertase Pin-like site-specific DNA recombinase
MIRERTSAGIAAARAEGRIGGRRKKLDVTKEPVARLPALG